MLDSAVDCSLFTVCSDDSIRRNHEGLCHVMGALRVLLRNVLGSVARRHAHLCQPLEIRLLSA